MVVFIALSIILNLIIYTDNKWNFYFIFGYFTDLAVPVNCSVAPDYRPVVVVKFSLFLVILFTDMYI
jgi:hypothetical protein